MSFFKLNWNPMLNNLAFKFKLVCNHVKFSSNKCGRLYAERLHDKCLIELKGKDTPTLLQGLITNDVNHLLEGSKAIYSMFLNNKGRVMLDSIIFKGQDEDTYYLECNSTSASVLKKHLSKYKLRKKVSVRLLEDDFSIYSVLSLKEVMNALPEDLLSFIDNDSKLCNIFKDCTDNISLESLQFDGNIAFRDPRLSALGYRVVVMSGSLQENEHLGVVKDSEVYRLCRYWLGVAEGEEEIPSEQCFPLESNCDYLHGVSFHKGCYIGQELTARSHHTGVIRKRIMPLVLDSEISDAQHVDILSDNAENAKKVGKLRGHLGKYALALLRINECIKLPQLYIGDRVARCYRPTWWPQESPKIIKQEVT